MGWDWVHLVGRPLVGLLYEPRMITMMGVEQAVEWELAGETEVLGENLPQCHSVNHKSHMPWSNYLSMAVQPLWTLPLFQFLNPYTVGPTTRTGDQPVVRPLPTHRTTQTQNKRTQTSMPRVGFEPIIPLFEGAKTIHALDRTATVIGPWSNWLR
jgi:hypothetical protein